MACLGSFMACRKPDYWSGDLAGNRGSCRPTNNPTAVPSTYLVKGGAIEKVSRAGSHGGKKMKVMVGSLDQRYTRDRRSSPFLLAMALFSSAKVPGSCAMPCIPSHSAVFRCHQSLLGTWTKFIKSDPRRTCQPSNKLVSNAKPALPLVRGPTLRTI